MAQRPRPRRRLTNEIRASVTGRAEFMRALQKCRAPRPFSSSPASPGFRPDPCRDGKQINSTTQNNREIAGL